MTEHRPPRVGDDPTRSAGGSVESAGGLTGNGAPGRRGFIRTVGAAAAGVATGGLAGCVGLGGAGGDDGGGTTATVFHAGSLAPPWSDVETAFEEANPDISVQREAKGSVGSTRKITDQGRRAEVLGVSDFRLIRDMVLPEYGEWYAIFATNAMTIAYTEDSKYAEEFGPDTWYDVLAREDVTAAHSDPAVDPNGYRSEMAMQLGAIELDGERLYSEEHAQTLIDAHSVPSGTETELVAQLRSGELDYAWEYQSAGASHDVQVVDLPAHVDLSKATDRYATHYAKARVSAGGTTYTGAPIAYGQTVPGVARNSGAGAAWVDFVGSERGREIMEQHGFTPVDPMVVPKSGREAVPDRVLEGAVAKTKLGPLDL